jgi:hypothetical protein
MAQTMTRAIVNAVKLIRQRGSVVFNDKLKDGRRSVKVWGWSSEDYEYCAETLRHAGLTVKVKSFNQMRSYNSTGYTQYRLIVTE